MVRTTLLGTGGPRPDPNRQGPGVCVQIDNDILLFDAGRGVSTQLVRAGIQPQNANPIFITHHHFDHIGNLGDLLLAAWNNGRNEPIHIYGPQGTRKIIAALLETVYAPDISFRLIEAALSQHKLEDIKNLVRVQDISPGLVHDAGLWQVYAEHVDHGHSLGISRDEWDCLGYRIETQGRIITISGDTVDCKGIRKLAQGADMLIMCSYLAEAEINDSDTELISRHILASPSEAGKIATHAGVKKLILTHIRKKSHTLLKTMSNDAHELFGGDVIVGEDLMVIES